ncbi:ChrR family anti-sigma-E factor [Ensifer soli]|uniref:ChrR family anti-sigma-E factor n=1 Tax=Ciceribacter sp. sgz301302 TaxID=3342379 RepID=UPI0035B9BC3D
MAYYAAGLLPEPARVLVEAHLQIRAAHHPLVERLETFAGALLEDTPPAALHARDAKLDAIFKASAVADPVIRLPAAASVATGVLPDAIRSFIGMDLDTVPWKTKIPGFKEFEVGTLDGCEVNLIWIRAGRAVPKHTHGGCELTLVLDGAFNDGIGRYGRGDISVADDAVDHRPVAEDERPCIAFAVVDAPLRLTGSLRQLFGDLIG